MSIASSVINPIGEMRRGAQWVGRTFPIARILVGDAAMCAIGSIFAVPSLMIPSGNTILVPAELLPIGYEAPLIRSAAEFGRLVRERRRAAGLTQDELAARCGVARRYVSELEAGKPTCQIGKAITVAVELGIVIGQSSAAGDAAASAAVLEPDPNDPLAHLPRF